jgi:hypothetical protein
MPLTLPASAVVRVSRANFDPARFDEAVRMSKETSTFLVPAIQKLPGLLGYYVGESPSGSAVHVSLWESDAHAQQMGSLKEMTVKARAAAEAAGLAFIPIVNYPITWSITP